jgi:hypothetical protein
MTKRTAMVMAAGVVAALLGGSLALAFGLSGNTAAVADTPARQDPIVRTIHRTVTVDRQARGSDQPVQVVTLSSDPASSTDPSEGDDSFEGESDDQYESEDQDESEDQESSDGSGEDGSSTSSSGSSEDGSEDD